MYGRGRGSYLGLLLESQTGKNAVGVSSTDSIDKTSNNNVVNQISVLSSSSSKQNVATQDYERKSLQPTWTSLDLLGNKGKRNRQAKDSFPKQAPEISQVNENDQNRDLPAHQSTSLDSEVVQDQKPKLSSESVKKMHLIRPNDFLVLPLANSSMNDEVPLTGSSEIDSSSDVSESNTSSSPRYIPPHRRKGYTGKPDIYPDPAVTQYKKLDLSRFPLTGERTVITEPQTLVESELSWQKWKLQRSFKKLLNNISSENVVGLNMDIRKACEASQLSAKFPGTSELYVFVDLLLSRVTEQKESFEVTVLVCRLLNVIYKDEFPANLKDVLRLHRQEIFSGVASKNLSCENFCILLGKLCDVAKDESKSFQDCLRQSVTGCLHDWISPFQIADECSREAEVKISYLCYLLEVTKTVLTTEKRSWIKSCFGKIKNCILSDKIARSVRENLLDHVIKLQSATAKESELLKATAESHSASKAAESVANSTDNSDTYKNAKKMLSERDIDPRVQVQDLEDNLKQVLVQIESEKQEQTKKENGDDKQTESGTDLANVESFDIKELPVKLMNIQSISDQAPITSFTSPCQPPPGFSSPGNEKRRTPTSEHIENHQAAKELPSENHIVESVSQREVIVGEKKNNIMEFKDENTQTGNPVVNVSQNGGSFKRNYNERTLPLKYKGRGRGRRDITGTLEDTKRDNSGFQGFSRDARETQWNSRGYQYGAVRDRNEFTEHSHWNKSDSPEMPWRGSSRPPSSWGGGIKGYPRKDHRPLGNKEEADGNTETSINDTFDADTTEDPEPRAELGLYSSVDAGLCTSRVPFGSSMPVRCFICGGKDHRSAYCKNNAAMFD